MTPADDLRRAKALIEDPEECCVRIEIGDTGIGWPCPEQPIGKADGRWFCERHLEACKQAAIALAEEDEK